jgi:hypothetical protein
MSGHHGASLELIERILPIADRSDLREVVAELLPSRAWAISADGRALEAVALLRGALAFAEREGFLGAEFRSRMNLSAWGSVEWPAEALEIAATGARRAREHGYLARATSLAGNACDCALVLGQWDRIESIAADIDALGDWTTPWQFTVPAPVADVRSYRGRTAEAREIIDRYVAQFPDLVDPQMLMTLTETRLHMAFSEGDLDEVMRLGRDLRPQAVSLGIGGVDYLVMGAAAIECGDVASLEEVVAVAGRGPDSGRLNRIRAESQEGGLRFIRGDRDGLLAIDRGSHVFRSEDIKFNLLVNLRTRAMLAPDADDAGAIAEEARALIAELGAVALLRGLPAAPVDALAPPEATTESQEPVAAT